MIKRDPMPTGSKQINCCTIHKVLYIISYTRFLDPQTHSQLSIEDCTLICFVWIATSAIVYLAHCRSSNSVPKPYPEHWTMLFLKTHAFKHMAISISTSDYTLCQESSNSCTQNSEKRKEYHQGAYNAPKQRLDYPW